MFEYEKQKNGNLEERRLLTEVHNLLLHRLPDGSYPLDVKAGIYENLTLKVQEDAMANAVSSSFQPVGEYTGSAQEKRRTFIWNGLGKTALQVAESGFEYHWSDAAHERVRVEIREAERSERELRAGISQSFISPRMSRKDAPLEIAKDEHLAVDDAIRVSYAVTDNQGRIIGRRTESLLVRDIPLSAWGAMLSDEKNMFGKSLEFDDPDSALSIMNLFDQLDLDEQLLPEGPITIVEAVAGYIVQPTLRRSVIEQIQGFREDQQTLRMEAENTAKEWLEFEIALAESLTNNQMKFPVKRFVMVHQNQWPEDVLEMLKSHKTEAGEYRLSTTLASKLEQAWQRIHLSETAVAVGDKKALKGLASKEIRTLQEEMTFMRSLQFNGYPAAEIERLRASFHQRIAIKNIQTGAGCSGQNSFTFKDGPDLSLPDPSRGYMEQVSQPVDAQKSEESKIGNKHRAECRTDGCPSRPGQTEVGGCDVCLKYCQPIYDRNDDPALIFGRFAGETKTVESKGLLDMFGIKSNDIKVVKKAVKTWAI